MILALVKIELAHSTRPLPLIKTETPSEHKPWRNYQNTLKDGESKVDWLGDTPVKSALGRIGIYPGLGTITAHDSEMTMSTDKKERKKALRKAQSLWQEI